MFVRFFALPIQFSPKLGSKIENTTLSLGKDKNKCHKMYFQQIRSKPNLLRWKCHKIAAKSNQEIHLRNILHRKMRIEDIFIFANSVHTSQNSSTIFTCVSVRDQAWHLHLSPPYDVLDQTNHIFSESLSSGDDIGQNKDLQKRQIQRQRHPDTDKDKYKVLPRPNMLYFS